MPYKPLQATWHRWEARLVASDKGILHDINNGLGSGWSRLIFFQRLLVILSARREVLDLGPAVTNICSEALGHIFRSKSRTPAEEQAEQMPGPKSVAQVNCRGERLCRPILPT